MKMLKIWLKDLVIFMKQVWQLKMLLELQAKP